MERFDMEKSLLYVYRISRFSGSGSSPYVCVDDRIIGELDDGGYFPLVLAPGQHKMELRAWGITNGTFYFRLKAGNLYYARADMTLYNGLREDGHPSQPDVAPIRPLGLVGAVDASYGPDGQAVRARVDKRAQVHSWNPGLLLIDPAWGDTEIRTTKLIAGAHDGSKPCN